MNEDPEVGAWLAELEHPLKDVILVVRAVFLEAVDAGRDGLTAVTRAWCDAKEKP
jgi:hypothetical protein